MKAIELKGLDQTLYYEKLENGLEVYMLPYKNKSNYTMHYLRNMVQFKQLLFLMVKKKK